MEWNSFLIYNFPKTKSSKPSKVAVDISTANGRRLPLINPNQKTHGKENQQNKWPKPS